MEDTGRADCKPSGYNPLIPRDDFSSVKQRSFNEVVEEEYANIKRLEEYEQGRNVITTDPTVGEAARAVKEAVLAEYKERRRMLQHLQQVHNTQTAGLNKECDKLQSFITSLLNKCRAVVQDAHRVEEECTRRIKEEKADREQAVLRRNEYAMLSMEVEGFLSKFKSKQ